MNRQIQPMNLRNPWQSYRQVATQTAPPGQLVLMLYDGAIRFLETARRGFELEDPLEFNQTINNNILRAQAILGELNASLDMRAGGQFADTMRSIYNYLDRRLDESNWRKEVGGVDEAIQRLTVLRDAWAEMLQGAGSQPADNLVEMPGMNLAMAG